MNKKAIVSGVAIVGLGAIGFLAGFAIGQKTRSAFDGKTEVEVKDGFVTVRADVYGAVKEGANEWVKSLTN